MAKTILIWNFVLVFNSAFINQHSSYKTDLDYLPETAFGIRHKGAIVPLFFVWFYEMLPPSVLLFGLCNVEYRAAG